jgi:cytoskeletal protein CcmA (bactofilin family)
MIAAENGPTNPEADVTTQKSATESRLGRDSRARGRLSGSGNLEIHGSMDGEIDWSGRLTVGENGRLEVSGKVGSLELRGHLDGRIDVANEAVVKSGARWTGGGAAPSLATEPGSWIDGEFRIRPPESGPGGSNK